MLLKDINNLPQIAGINAEVGEHIKNNSAEINEISGQQTPIA